jgi:hypothetical protein
MCSSPEKTPPTAEQLMDDYIEATGGKAAYEKIRTQVSKGTMEIAGSGIKMSMTSYQAYPDKFYTVVESEVTGKIESGFDGEVVWENSALNGPQIKEGDERAFLVNYNRLDGVVNWRKIFKKVELKGEEIFDGKPCYILKSIPWEGPPIISYCDKRSKLTTRVKLSYKNRMGTIDVDVYSFEYREINGILLPLKFNMKMMGMENVVTIDSVKHNVDIPDSRFQLPEAIRALLE